jgi:DNA-directed RNA polymerase specialized sigma24 family protein
VDRSVDELLARFRSGDEAAGAELFERFSVRMLSLVRRQLSQSSHRAAIDSEAIVQEGFRSFFSAVRKPQFDARKGNIGGLLTRIVLRKAQTKLRRKYPANLAPNSLDAAYPLASLLDGNLSEQEAELVVRENVLAVLCEFSARERHLVELFLDPRTERSIAEVARTSRRSLTTVEHVVDRFIESLQKRVGSERDHQNGAV